jgi:hypothetical protein
MTESLSERDGIEDDGFGDTVYEGGDPDSDTLDPEDDLTGDGSLESFDENEETGYSPPERQPQGTRYGTTELEQLQGESLDQKLSEEEPDISADDLALDDEDPRAGRLVAPDEGAHADLEKDEIAFDVGRAGFGSSAEEAAMHVIDEDELDSRF